MTGRTERHDRRVLMRIDTPGTLRLVLAATLMLAGPGHATPQGPAPGAAPAPAALLHPAQATAPGDWTRHSALGFALSLPDSFFVVQEAEGSLVFANALRPGPGATAVGISDSPQMYAGYMDLLRQLPPDTPATSGTRDFGPLGSFRTVTYDLRGLPDNRALLAVLAATGPDAEGRMRMVAVQAFAQPSDPNWNWDEARALVEDILATFRAADD